MVELFCSPRENTKQFVRYPFLRRLAAGPLQHVIAEQNLAYKTACNSCTNISLCDTCIISNPDTVALCEPLLDHTDSPDASGTLASLCLEKGYWRATNVSRKILPCYHKGACLGGVAETCGGVFCERGYCATGYTGPCEWGVASSWEIMVVASGQEFEQDLSPAGWIGFQYVARLASDW